MPHVSAPIVLVTGQPGVGKTTLCSKISDALRANGTPTTGFLTEERRAPLPGKGRLGFDVVCLKSGERASLAQVGTDAPTVGKYTVTIDKFEALALPILTRLLRQPKGQAIVIDEIGKMEMFSSKFVASMRKLLHRPHSPVLCTVAVRGRGFVEEVKRLPGVQIVTVTKANRNVLLSHILAILEGTSTAEHTQITTTLQAQPQHQQQRLRSVAPCQIYVAATLSPLVSSKEWEDIQCVVVWFGDTDLRANDNASLHSWPEKWLQRCINSGENQNTVVPVYVWRRNVIAARSPLQRKFLVSVSVSVSASTQPVLNM